MSLKKDLEKQLEERVNELKTTKTVANSFTNQLKEKLEQITEAKVRIGGGGISLAELNLFRIILMKKMPHYVYKYKN